MCLGIDESELFLRIIVAALLGAAIGIEREHKKKEAGLKTFSLISLGACLFTVLSLAIGQLANGLTPDPARVIQAVALGIGFVGSGLIIYHRSKIEGLTTASALWTSAAVGVSVGLGLIRLAIFVSVLIILILAGFRLLEERVFNKK